jgi:anti-sigma regulatory factor (Ser/Thr protein kinase)
MDMCELTDPVELTLPRDTAAPSLARRFVEDVSCNVHNASVLDEAKLLVSELVTNAVEHGAPPVTVKIECDGSEGLKVCVSDRSRDPLEPRNAGPLDEGGRGLTLVELISSEWGVEPSDGGKEVWFSIKSENSEVSYAS